MTNKFKRYFQGMGLIACTTLVAFPTVLMSCSKVLAQHETTSGMKKLKADLVVAADGSGDHKTLQDAIDAVPGNLTTPFYIYIKKGIYKQVVNIPKGKDYIYLYGEDAASTVLTFDNYAKRLNADGKEYGTSGSASFFANGNFFVAENLTFENTAGIDAGQALAININSSRSSFKNCRFLGHQDTWYAANGTFQYLKNCYLEGSVDFMFGGSTAFFEACELVSTRNGYLTAASTPENQLYGYVFQKCKVSAYPTVAEGTVYLGRPWRPNARVVFLESELGKQIRKEGWHNWGKVENEATAFYAEYNSTGAGASPSTRVAWSHQLSGAQAADYTLEKVIGKSHPQFIKGNKVVVSR